MPAAATSSSTNQTSAITEYGALMQPPNLLLEDVMTVSNVDHSRFDKVGRITLESQETSTKLEYDVYTELYPVEVGESLHIVMLKTLALGEKLESYAQHDKRVLGANIADKFGYVTYGTCYERSQKDGKTTVHISFGGLLMRATSEDTHLRGINLDDRVYCLVKKDDLVS